MRTWSGKIAAARSVNVPQDPLVLYHPPTPPQLYKRSQPWKRSRAVRISMRMRHRRARWKRTRPNNKKIWSIVAVVFSLLVVISGSGTSASAYAYYQSQLPRLQGLATQVGVDQTTHIYDRNGQLLFDAYDSQGRSTPVTYNNVPGVMQDAMVAAEDNTFWDNTGINPLAIIRAATQNVRSTQIQSGASTITQQLVKNLTHDTQDTVQRKIPEAALAIGLTQQYPKWKILEMYFNVAPFGAQDIGVEAATEDFFGLTRHCDQNFNCTPAIVNLALDKHGKPDPVLALARASLLAGMPQNPPAYDPTLGPDNVKLALIRQDYVLTQMLALKMHINLGLGGQVNDYGPITADLVNQAEALTAKMTFPGYRYFKHDPHFVDWVITQLEIALGNGDAEAGTHLFLTGGFNIRTTIDSSLESFVGKAIYRHLDEQEYQPLIGGYGPLNTVENVNDSAVVVMNAKDGEVLAMDGSADFNSKDPKIDGQYNAAISPRQPGSSFKPIVYATAYEMGWYPGIVLPDIKTYFPKYYGPQSGTPQSIAYTPADYGGSYNNKNWPVHMDLQSSFNIPAIKALMYAGNKNVLAMAERLGITGIDPKTLGPAFALGTAGVSLLQMVGAYQAFANQGMRVPPQGVLDIWDNYGHHIYHFDPKHPQGVQVISKQIAFLMTSTLTDENARSYEFEGDHVLSMWDWTLPDGTHPQVAAKTGTTDSFRDNWTIGYTPDVVVGVWSGNADNSTMNGVIGITGAAPIWHSVIEQVSGHCEGDPLLPCGTIHTVLPPQPFPTPPGVVQQTVSAQTGLYGTGYTDWMLESDIPQPMSGDNGNATGYQNGIPTTP